MNEILQRYLVPFSPKQIPHFFTDVLVIGGGLAGLRAACAVAPKLSVLVVSKEGIEESSSNYAQGGIAGVVDPDDCVQSHVDDTLAVGGELCNVDVVSMVVNDAPQRIRELIRWGTHFDETRAGVLELGREGGHSRNRVAHAMGDATGREIMRAMIKWTKRLRNVELREHTFALDLLTHDGVCRGALVADERHGLMLIWARQTILCAGGAGQIYRESTNPPVATGDGHAIAYRAGVQLRDMEFVQFHPTVLYIAGSSRNLITEAVRGEGARLVDHSGYRFLPDYDARGELAPRDVVSQAIVTQMEKTAHPNVYLDMTHLDPDFVRNRFPGIAAKCREFDIDITTDRIPVRPGAHYMIGGVIVDRNGRTTLPGLWAAGEVTSSGLHGANRLASNSLLEAVVYGARVGGEAAAAAAAAADLYRAFPIESPPIDAPTKTLDLADIRNSLVSLMWRYVGVRRQANRMTYALEMIDHWQQYVQKRQFWDSRGWELQNMLTTARLIVRGALAREESRGVHFRTDFPETDNQHWQRHLHVQRDAFETDPL
ncbi:MAG: L-aspartate oxidase [Planctomycetota bacterium]